MSRSTGPSTHTPAIGTEGAMRVADVLLLFLGAENNLGVSQVARSLDLSKAVVHRVLQSMVARDLLAQDSQTRLYQLGPAAAAIGARALRDSDLRSVAEPILRALRDTTNETTTLSQLQGAYRVYISQFPSPQEIKMLVELGRMFPLHAGSSSKVILCNLDDERRGEIVDGFLEQVTPSTQIDPTNLRHELDDVREQGFCISRGERQPGAGAVAAPLFDFTGSVVGAISVCGPAQRFDEGTVNRLIPQVTRAAEEISAGLGFVAEPSVSAEAR